MKLLKESAVVVEREEWGVRLVLNAPQHENSLTADTLRVLLSHLEELTKDAQPGVVVLAGAGQSFSSGADLRSIADLGPRPIAEWVELGVRVCRQIEQLPRPVLGVAEGLALAEGLELLLACDMVVAADNARFAMPHCRAGLVPAFGSLHRLVRRCGQHRALRLLLTAEMIDAGEAFAWGLVDRIVSSEQLGEETLRVVTDIRRQAPLALKAVKRLMFADDEQAQLAASRREGDAFLELFKTADREEGIQAILQGRDARFTGR